MDNDQQGQTLKSGPFFILYLYVFLQSSIISISNINKKKEERMKRFGLIIALVCIFAVGASAAPVDVPVKAKEMKGADYIFEDLDIAFLMGGDVDYVDELDLDRVDTEVEAMFYTGKIGVSVDMVDIYALLGQVRDVQYTSMVSGADIKYEMEEAFTWGVGLSALIYEWERFGIKFFGDVKYRTIEDMDYDMITLEGLGYSNDQLTEAKTKAGWEEWQAALSVGKKLGYLMPYFGVKYSDVDLTGSVTLDGVVYDLGTVNSGDNVGVFAGCSIVPVESLSVDLQARFFDEKGFSVSLVHEF